MMNYYNEIDPYPAEWLGNLIRAGAIARGAVDTRSIRNVHAGDLDGFAQCHFFAGIGIWSYALRAAGWPDDRPVWTGSCPCQPFSASGKGEGFADPRHLWPDFYRLIAAQRPVTIFGEQVDGRHGLAWLDVVQTDLENSGYTFGAVIAPAAGFGAPHRRHRIYWVAHAVRTGWPERRAGAGRRQVAGVGGARELAHAPCGERQGCVVEPTGVQFAAVAGNGVACELGDAEGERGRLANGSRRLENPQPVRASEARERPGPVNGFWRDADWLKCTDNKWRPIEPGTFPLAHGHTARMGKLRAYGNAIVAPQAIEFVKAAMQCM